MCQQPLGPHEDVCGQLFEAHAEASARKVSDCYGKKDLLLGEELESGIGLHLKLRKECRMLWLIREAYQ